MWMQFTSSNTLSVRSNLILFLPPMLRSSERSFPFRISNWNFVLVSCIPMLATWPVCLSSLDNIWRGAVNRIWDSLLRFIKLPNRTNREVVWKCCNRTTNGSTEIDIHTINYKLYVINAKWWVNITSARYTAVVCDNPLQVATVLSGNRLILQI
jgi:hypothetical protein